MNGNTCLKGLGVEFGLRADFFWIYLLNKENIFGEIICCHGCEPTFMKTVLDFAVALSQFEINFLQIRYKWEDWQSNAWTGRQWANVIYTYSL